MPTSDPGGDKVMDVTILGQRFLFQPLSRERGAEDRRNFLVGNGGQESPIWIHGFDIAGRLLSLDTGEEIAASVPAALVGTPARLLPHLMSSSREVHASQSHKVLLEPDLVYIVIAEARVMAVYRMYG